MALPEDVAATHPDRGPGDTAHQQHHDEIHTQINILTETGEAGQVLTKRGDGSIAFGGIDIYPSALGDYFLLPHATPVGFWGGATAFSSNTPNSSQTVPEIQFDAGAPGGRVSSVSIYCNASNDGAGAAVRFAIYEMTSPISRSLISEVDGEALIGTTGAKTVTLLAPIEVPRVFAIHAGLVNLNMSGANPTFGFSSGPPLIRVSGTFRTSAGNNVNRNYPATSRSVPTAWPEAVEVTGSVASQFLVEVGMVS
jgi:hypothetical protein